MGRTLHEVFRIRKVRDHRTGGTVVALDPSDTGADRDPEIDILRLVQALPGGRDRSSGRRLDAWNMGGPPGTRCFDRWSGVDDHDGGELDAPHRERVMRHAASQGWRLSDARPKPRTDIPQVCRVQEVGGTCRSETTRFVLSIR